MKQTRKDLLHICKERNIKGVSRKSKDELLQIIAENTFNRDVYLKNLRVQIMDDKDPISLEPLNEWTDEELQSGILLHKYFYKEETIKNYINSSSLDEMKDPINEDLKLDREMIDKYRMPEQKLNPKQIKVVVNITSVPTFYNNFYFYNFHLQLTHPLKNITTDNLTYDRRNRGFYLGCIPLNINLSHEIQNPFEMKALDTMSTTDALMVRISNLYQGQKFISVTDNKVHIRALENLPKDPKQWFSISDDFYYINTEAIQGNEQLSTYNKLLKELDMQSV